MVLTGLEQPQPDLAAAGERGHCIPQRVAINTGSGTVSRYSIDTTGNLTLLGTTPVNGNGGVGATDATVSPDGQNLYINKTAAYAVAEMTINGSSLTELPASPIGLPASITASAGAACN